MEAQKQAQKNENEKIQVSLNIMCIENDLFCLKESIFGLQKLVLKVLFSNSQKIDLISQPLY